MSVRLALPGDAAALADVAGATFALACPPTTTQTAIDAFVAEALSETAFDGYLADPSRVLLVDGGSRDTLAGYAMLVFAEPADPDVAAVVRVRPTCELSKIYVRSGQHGRGTAGALLACSLEVAGERGAAGIWLGTNQQNERAQRFYGKHGFERVGVKRFRLGGQWEDDFVYERAL